MICVFIHMTGTPEGSTESGFMDGPGIEPATPGLQGIALIHYTTGAYIFCAFYVCTLTNCTQTWQTSIEFWPLYLLQYG